MVIKAVQDGTSLDSDWTGTLKTGSVVLTDVNEKVAAKGTAEKIAEVTKQLEDGTLHVFDTFRSAPYFDLQIDGINLLDQNFGS